MLCLGSTSGRIYGERGRQKRQRSSTSKLSLSAGPAHKVGGIGQLSVVVCTRSFRKSVCNSSNMLLTNMLEYINKDSPLFCYAVSYDPASFGG